MRRLQCVYRAELNYLGGMNYRVAMDYRAGMDYRAEMDHRAEMDYCAEMDYRAEMNYGGGMDHCEEMHYQEEMHYHVETDSFRIRASELAVGLMEEPRIKGGAVRRAEEQICAEEGKEYENWGTPKHCFAFLTRQAEATADVDNGIRNATRDVLAAQRPRPPQPTCRIGIPKPWNYRANHRRPTPSFESSYDAITQ
jgi:hypothetical protein